MLSRLFTLTVLVAVTTEVYSDCGDVVSNPSGNVSMPSNVTATKPCVITINRDAKAKISSTALRISQLTLTDNDTLIVYDGNGNDNRTVVASYAAGAKVPFQAAVTFQPNATIVYTPSSDKPTSTWTIYYSTEECSFPLSNSWVSKVVMPKYVNTTSKQFLCSFSVTNTFPSDRRAVVSFRDLKLTDKSTLTLKSGNVSATYTSNDTSGAVDFFAQVDEPVLVVNVSVSDASKDQSFSVVIEPVVSECSKEYKISNNVTISQSITFPTVPYECRWLIKSASSVLIANVTALNIVANSDQLSFIDGGSSGGAVVKSLISNVNGYMVIGSGQSMVVTLKLGSSDVTRLVNLDLMESSQSKRITGSGSLEVKDEKLPTDKAYFQLTANTGMLVSVQLVKDLVGKSSVTFYDGMQLTDPVLASLTATNQALKTVTGTSAGQMLVVVTNLAAGELFTATFTSLKPGCDGLATGQSGEMIFVEDQTVTKARNCTWTVAPADPTGTIVFDLDSVKLGANESLKVYGGLDDKYVITQFFGPVTQTMPLEIYMPAADRMKVVVTGNDKYVADTEVAMRYRVTQQACGGELTIPYGDIKSPTYPNMSPLHANCTWTLNSTKAGANRLIYFWFDDLDLTHGHSVTIKNSTFQYALYGGVGRVLPADLIFPLTSDLVINFQTIRDPSVPVPPDVNDVGGGFNLTYWVLDCGMNISSSTGSVKSPEFPAVPTKSSQCIWIIDVGTAAPKNSANIVNFTIATATGKPVPSLEKYLRIYDGNTTRDPFLHTNVSSAGSSGFVLSQYNRLVVVYNYTHVEGTKENVGFSLNFTTFTCSPSQQCDNGKCMHPDWRCNAIDDCGDNSDERGCLRPLPPKPLPADYSGWVKSGWIPGSIAIGLVLGIVLVLVVPKIIQRLRGGGGGSYSRMDDNHPVVA